MSGSDKTNHNARVDSLFRKLLTLNTAEAHAYLKWVDEPREVVEKVAALLSDSEAGSQFLASGAGLDALLDESQEQGEGEILSRGLFIGRYMILDTLGTGGMGVVYSAYDPELDRKIAIKLLRADKARSAGASYGETRLMLEARALAKLSHPNVLPIFDVGDFEGQVFLAMELVRGKTLKERQNESSYSWREILDFYVRAGRGLAAAHDADVVHRDFKPENIMLGNDGQVRVMDFGLASSLSSHSSDEAGSIGDTQSADSLTFQLTQTGILLGTPAYMSPEQFEGHFVGPASDQFSFAVALYEALFGNRPFAGKRPDDLLENVRKGLVSPPTAEVHVPARLRRVLLKALHYDPEERYPNMTELLAVLARNSTRRREQWLGGITIAAIAAGSLIYLNLQQPDAVCKGASQNLAAIWDEPRKSQIESAFLATGVAYAVDTWRSVEGLFDGYADNWIAAHTEACEATHIRGEQSERLLDLRMICLEGRKQEFKALTDLFVGADANMISNAVKAASAISGLESCSDIKALTARVPLPSNAVKRQAVHDLEGELARAKALRQTAQYGESEKLARKSLDSAQSVGYLPLLAHAGFRVGEALDYLGDAEQAEAFFQQAFTQAIAGADDRRAAQIAVAQVWVIGHILTRPKESKKWGETGHALLARLGGDKLIEADLLGNEGTVAQDQGRYEQALFKANRVLELRQQVLGERHERVAAAMVNLANAKRHFDDQGGVEDTIVDLYQRALTIFADTLGREHPTNVVVLYNLGGALSEAGNYQDAHPLLIESVALARRSLGPDHFETAAALQNLAEVELALNQFEQSLANYQTAISIFEAHLGAQHPFLLSAITGIVGNLVELGRYEESRKYMARGLSFIADKEGQELALSMFRMAAARIALNQDNDRVEARKLAIEAQSLASAVGLRAIEHRKRIQIFLDSL